MSTDEKKYAIPEGCTLENAPRDMQQIGISVGVELPPDMNFAVSLIETPAGSCVSYTRVLATYKTKEELEAQLLEVVTQVDHLEPICPPGWTELHRKVMITERTKPISPSSDC